jgi:hypothetical protein
MGDQGERKGTSSSKIPKQNVAVTTPILNK